MGAEHIVSPLALGKEACSFMFRRFRRSKSVPPAAPAVPPPLLPAPADIFHQSGDIPTTPLRAIPREDSWLLGENAHRFAQPTPTPSNPLRRQPVIAVDPAQVAQALEAYVNAPDWAASQRVVEDRPELLTGTALMLLRANVSRIAEQVGPGASQTLARYLQTLEVAQREGIDFAFDRMPSPHTSASPDLEALLNRLESPALAQNLAERIGLCEAALPLAARDQNDELWAALQRELGLLLPRLRVGDHAQHIERAIESLSAALQIFTQLEYPADWAMTQHYLGLAFLTREHGNRSENIESAIEALEAAQEIRTHEDMPAEWAATQEALGSAFFHRQIGLRSDNLDRCVAAFEGALQVRSREKTPYEWATDQLSLGNAYGQRTTGTRMGNIEQAITGFEAALTYFTRENAPDQWALIQHNLGVAYSDRLFGNRSENIERAIEHYELSMQMQTRERAPLEWADTRNNLANALRERQVGDHAENLRRAIACYQDALRIRTRDAFLSEHRRSARNLGTLLFEQGRWAEAHDAFAGALAASETLYLLGLGEQGPTARLREHGELVALDACCLLRLNRPRDAAQRLESGRARALDEMLERDRLALQAAPAEARRAFVQAQNRLYAVYQAAQRLIAAGGQLTSDTLQIGQEQPMTGMRRSRDDLAFERREAQSALDTSIAAIRATRADFLHPALAFKQIAGTVGTGQALVYLALTNQGAAALIVPAAVTELRDEHILWAPELTLDKVEQLAPLQDDEATVFKTQLGVLPRPQVLDGLLAALGRDLMAPLAERLARLKISSVALIPTGRLAAIPLHAAPIGAIVPVRDEEGEADEAQTDALFLDAFEVTYTPSAQRLGMARAGAAMVLRSGVAMIGNPQPASMDLEWAEHEAEAVAQVANKAGQSYTLLIRRKASAEAVTKAMQERAYIHLACASGFYPERPLESYLELAGGDTLKLADVLTGQIRTRGIRLVALSAGQSAISTANAPDESIGMASALLLGGIGGVVASIWPASDLATLMLMRRFAQFYLSEDQRPAQALRNAQRWLRRLTLTELARDYQADIGRDPDLNLADMHRPEDCPFAHPVYWAGFALHGA